MTVRKRLEKQSIKLDYHKGFNSHVLNLVMDFYNVKQEERFAYEHKLGNTKQYTYSEQFVEFIVTEVKKNPEKIVESLKSKV